MTELGAVAPLAEADVLSAGIAAIRDRLPTSWQLSAQRDEPRGDSRVDAILSLRAPDGGEVTLIVEAKRLIEGRDVAAVTAQLARYGTQFPGSIGMVIARYLSESTRKRLRAAGLAFADATGNVLVRADSPALFISDRGSDNDPWRGRGRPRGTLKGEPAAKVVRALADTAGPWKIRDLVAASGASTGSTYRVIEFLESEALVTRGTDGLINVPEWAPCYAAGARTINSSTPTQSLGGLLRAAYPHYSNECGPRMRPIMR